MFVAVPMASAITLHPIGYQTYPAVSQLNMHTGPSQNDTVTGTAGSNQDLCAAYWATGETIYFVGNGQLQADNTWYDLYSMTWEDTVQGSPEGWSNALYVNYPQPIQSYYYECISSYASYQ